mgnify:CR=1 FL=1
MGIQDLTSDRSAPLCRGWRSFEGGGEIGQWHSSCLRRVSSRGFRFSTQIRQQIEETTSDYDKEKLQERLAKLAGGVALIKVGAATEVELKEKKHRIEDAVSSVRAAIEEGVVAEPAGLVDEPPAPRREAVPGTRTRPTPRRRARRRVRSARRRGETPRLRPDDHW